MNVKHKLKTPEVVAEKYINKNHDNASSVLLGNGEVGHRTLIIDLT